MNERSRKPPRVCVLIESYHPVVGGMERQALTLSAGLSALGVPHRVVTRRITADMPVSESINGIPVVRIGPVGTQGSGRWSMVPRALLWLLRHREDYDIVLVPGFRTLGVAAVLARTLTGHPCVLKADSRGELSGDFFAAGLARRGFALGGVALRLFMTFWRRVLCTADAFVSMSSEMTGEFTRSGVQPERIRRIPNAVDTSVFKPVAADEKASIRAALGVPAGVTVFVYTGRLVAYKGLPLLLEAWQRLALGNEEVLLLLVGGGGYDLHNCEEALRAFAAGHGLDRSVRFVGETSAVHRYLQASDIFVFPTEEEAFGLSLIEAMACGLPAISTMVGGIGDFLRDGENGMAVEAGSVEALVAAMRCLLADPGRRKALGAAAAETAKRDYSLEQVCGSYALLLAEVASRSRTPGQKS